MRDADVADLTLPESEGPVPPRAYVREVLWRPSGWSGWQLRAIPASLLRGTANVGAVADGRGCRERVTVLFDVPPGRLASYCAVVLRDLARRTDLAASLEDLARQPRPDLVAEVRSEIEAMLSCARIERWSDAAHRQPSSRADAEQDGL